MTKVYSANGAKKNGTEKNWHLSMVTELSFVGLTLISACSGCFGLSVSLTC